MPAKNVEKIQWTGDNADEVAAFTGDAFHEIHPDNRQPGSDATGSLYVAERGMRAQLPTGAWIQRTGERTYDVLTEA